MEQTKEVKKEDYGNSLPLDPNNLPGSGFRPKKPYFDRTGNAVVAGVEMFQVDKKQKDARGQFFTPSGFILKLSAKIDNNLVEWDERVSGLCLYEDRVFWGDKSGFGQLVLALRESTHKVDGKDWDENTKTMIPYLTGRKVQLIGVTGVTNGNEWSKNVIKTFID
jgi:hypothetical protein